MVAELALTIDRGFNRIAVYAERTGISVLGTNCVEPEQALRSLVFVAKGAAVPLSAFPSAGLPGEETSPAEFASRLEELVVAGARFVGGCCGTGPAHIRAAASRLRRGR